MTNPTLPLTAEDIVDSIRKSNTLDYFKAVDDIEAFATQQNAELVATVSQLNSDIAGLKSQLKDAEINFKALAERYCHYRNVRRNNPWN